MKVVKVKENTGCKDHPYTKPGLQWKEKIWNRINNKKIKEEM